MAWRNVEKAIAALEEAGLLTPEALYRCPTEELGEKIRTTLYYRQKAKKIKAFLAYLFQNHGGDLDRMFRLPPDRLRRELLEIYGIGEETADSILLYAGVTPSLLLTATPKGSFPGWVFYRRRPVTGWFRNIFRPGSPKTPNSIMNTTRNLMPLATISAGPGRSAPNALYWISAYMARKTGSLFRSPATGQEDHPNVPFNLHPGI